MMKGEKKRGFLGSAGLTLVELIVSMAILAVIGAAIGGAMFVSSRSYTRGSAEVDVQKEAQVASNLICDWLIDATEVSVDPSGSTLTLKHPEGSEEVVITVSVGSGNLNYTATSPSGSHSGILASHVSGASFISTFNIDRNVKFSIDFAVDDRTYHAVTDSTSRSHDFISTHGGAPTDGEPNITFNIPAYGGSYYVVLEPGQRDYNGAAFDFEALVTGCDPSVTNLVISGGGDPSTDQSAVGASISRIGTTNKWTVHTQSGDNASTPATTFTFTATNTSTGVSKSKTVTVLIRRATKCEFNTHLATTSSGDKGKAGTLYNAVSVDLGIQQRGMLVPGANYDRGTFAYIDPSQVEYYFRYSDGTDASAAIDFANTIMNKTGDNLSIQVKLLTDINKNIEVVAVATHSGVLPASNSDTYGASTYDTSAPAYDKCNNKVKKISGGNFTYTGSSNHNVAYYDVFTIEKGSGGSITNVGAGFQRGSQAFCLGKLDAEGVQRVYDTMNSYPGTQRNDWLQVVSFKYCVKGVSPVVYSDTCILNINNGNIDPNQCWNIFGTNSTGNKQYLADLFDCDKAYTIIVNYDLMYVGSQAGVPKYTSLCHYDNSGSLNACDAYVYDQSTNKYIKTDESAGTLGSSSNPIEVNKNNQPGCVYSSLTDFYVYFDSMNCFNNNPYKIQSGCYTVEKYNETEHRWESATKIPNIAGVQNYGLNSGQLTFDDTSITAKNVGNFSQNDFPDPKVSVVKSECGAYQNNENGHYRVTFTTQSGGQRASVTSKGEMPSPTNSNGSTMIMNLHNSSAEPLGTIYFDIVNF